MSGELDPAAFAEAPHVRPASIRAWGIAGHECHRLPSPLGEILQEIARSDALGQERTLLVAQVPRPDQAPPERDARNEAPSPAVRWRNADVLDVVRSSVLE
jgi:hypothetical protein